MPNTLVLFHAHPDDEAIATGGTIARAAAEGHRVVLVVATRGELGEYPEGILAPGETIGDRRAVEQLEAARVLGVHRVEFLGYHDSGMAGEATNDDPAAFCRADVDEAAARLAGILRDERADVLTIYDDHGGYGHPDHIQVHRVGLRAAELAGTPRVYEATMNRDHLRALLERAAKSASEDPNASAGESPGEAGDDRPGPEDLDTFGSPASAITTTVDVRAFTGTKRAAMAAHASQIAEESFFLAMPDEWFREVFGHEWFIRTDRRDARETSLFDGLVD